MRDFPAPRRAESILEALGADTDFRQAVIGDLAVVATAVTPDGRATDEWLAILGTRLTPARYDSVARLQNAMSPEENRAGRR